MLDRILSYFSKYSSRSKQAFKNIQPGDVCIDCGANVGLVTLEMLKKGAVVHAFEPNIYAYEKLQERTKEYGSSCKIYNAGVWDRQDKMKLYLHEWSDQDQVKWSTGSSFVQEKENVRSDKYTEVDVIRLSDFIRNLNTRVKMLKIDIEGAEYETVTDLIETGVYQNIDKIYVETHAHKIKALEKRDMDLRDLIKKRGIKTINLDWL